MSFLFLFFLIIFSRRELDALRGQPLLATILAPHAPLALRSKATFVFASEFVRLSLSFLLTL